MKNDRPTSSYIILHNSSTKNNSTEPKNHNKNRKHPETTNLLKKKPTNPTNPRKKNTRKWLAACICRKPSQARSVGGMGPFDVGRRQRLGKSQEIQRSCHLFLGNISVPNLPPLFFKKKHFRAIDRWAIWLLGEKYGTWLTSGASVKRTIDQNHLKPV